MRLATNPLLEGPEGSHAIRAQGGTLADINSIAALEQRIRGAAGV